MKMDPLEEVGLHYKVEAVRNPDFKAAVWSRIERRAGSPAGCLDWLLAHLRGVAAGAAAGICAAALAGALLARPPGSGGAPDPLESYLTSIDPHRQMAQAEGGER